MKKIVGILSAAAVLASSVFAAEVSGGVRLSGDLFNFNGETKTVSALKLTNDNQFWHSPLTLSVSSDEAGATIKFTDGDKDAFTTGKWAIWFKPMDALKVNLGTIAKSTNQESITWTKNLISYDSFGASLDVNAGAFSATVAVVPGKGNYWFVNDVEAQKKAAADAAVKKYVVQANDEEKAAELGVKYFPKKDLNNNDVYAEEKVSYLDLWKMENSAPATQAEYLAGLKAGVDAKKKAYDRLVTLQKRGGRDIPLAFDAEGNPIDTAVTDTTGYKYDGGLSYGFIDSTLKITDAEVTAAKTAYENAKTAYEKEAKKSEEDYIKETYGSKDTYDKMVAEYEAAEKVAEAYQQKEWDEAYAAAEAAAAIGELNVAVAYAIDGVGTISAMFDAKDSFKTLSAAAGFAGNAGSISYFADGAFYKAADGNSIGADAFVNFSQDAIAALAYVQFKSPLDFAADKMTVLTAAKFAYTLDAGTVWVKFVDENVLAKDFAANIDVAFDGSVGIMSYELGASAGIKGNVVNFSVPVWFSVNF